MVAQIDKISFTSYFLHLLVVDKNAPENLLRVSNATGFVYKKNDKMYLITNLHVVSGRDINTGKVLDSMARIPEVIRTVSSLYNVKTGFIQKCVELTISLYDKDGNPNWFIHPKYKHGVDIAVMPINFENPPNLFAINDVESVSAAISVADDVFVIGYPLALGTNETQDFPIWKRASIASEPNINYFADGRGAFIVDGTTREGMSGSPVFFYNNFSQTNLQDGGVCFNMSPQRLFCFLGVYSGRLYGASSNTEDNKKDSFLGLVWKKELIDEIIDGGFRDEAY